MNKQPAPVAPARIATVTLRFGGVEYTAEGSSLLAAAFEAAGKAGSSKEEGSK